MFFFAFKGRAGWAAIELDMKLINVSPQSSQFYQKIMIRFWRRFYL